MAHLIDGSARRRWRVWRVFTAMDRGCEYGLKEVATVLGYTSRELVAKIEKGEVEARQVKGDWMIRWPEVAMLAVEKWGLAHISAELGEKGAKYLPPLVRSRQLTVNLPAYQVVMLERLAAREGVTAEAFLSGHLVDLAASVAEEMEKELPGFLEALRYPEDA